MSESKARICEGATADSDDGLETRCEFLADFRCGRDMGRAAVVGSETFASSGNDEERVEQYGRHLTEGVTVTKNEAGTALTCSNPDCGCSLRIEKPCPHGDTYTCACGHQMKAEGEGDSDA